MKEVTDRKCLFNQLAQRFLATTFCLDETQASDLARSLAACVEGWFAQAQEADPLLFVSLNGEMGTGKTTFMRHFAVAFGVQESVTSPTYTIVNIHQANHRQLIHGDLYRIGSLQELDELQIFDVDAYAYDQPTLLALEWASNWQAHLPVPDITIEITDTPHCTERCYRLSSPNARFTLDHLHHSGLQLT